MVRTTVLSTALYAMMAIALLLPALACEDSNWSGVWCEIVNACAYVLDFPLGTVLLSPAGEPRFPLHAIPNGIVVGIAIAFGCRGWQRLKAGRGFRGG